MAEIIFTSNLQRHIEAPSAKVQGSTVREALDCVFGGNPKLRGYVVDEQGALRKHMMIFVDGEQIHDREQLLDPIAADASIYVMQALSGG